MSPTRRNSASTVTGLRKAVGPVPEQAPAGTRNAPARGKDVRITLNMPVELFRQLTHWADFAAEELGAPRISVQNALRAMVWAGVADASPSSPVLAELRRTAR